MANAVIGCKLPNGIILKIDGKQVEVPGRNSSHIKDQSGRGLGDGSVTVHEVPSENVKAFFEKHASFKPIASGAVYLASSDADAKRKPKETESKKTGQEPVSQTDTKDGTTKA